MPIVAKIQNGWTAGELDPKLRARTDVASYYSGAAKLRNALIIPQGAIKRRPGLEYVTTLNQGNIQFIPFTFSDTEHYLCILTTNLLSIYKQGQLMDTVACTISSDQIPDVSWAQSYDTLLIFHQEFTPQAFIRASEKSWSNSSWTLNNAPSKNFAGQTTTILTVVDSADANIDFSAWTTGDSEASAKFSASGATWVAGDVGKYIRGSLGGYAKITAFTDVTHVVCTVLAAFTNDNKAGTTVYAAGEWAMEETSWSATYGYPACGTFFQGRLWMANTTKQPNTIWASRTNDEYDFQSWNPSYDDNGIEITAGGGIMSKFKRLYAGQHLFVLADTGEYYIPKSKSEGVTPTNASLVRNSSFGSLSLTPFDIDGAVIFMRAGGKSLIESQYNFANGSYINVDLSLLASHLLDDPVSMAYRKQSNTDEADYVLIVNGDGSLSVLCTLRNQKITAWSQCSTEGYFRAVAVDNDEMYFAIDRTLNGGTVRTLEKFNSDLLVDCGLIDPTTNLTYDDAGTADQLTYNNINLTYKRSTTTTVSGLSYLNGEKVVIVGDNTIQPAQTISGDTITLERSCVDVQVGLNFPVVDTDSGSQVYIETMPIEVDLADGTSVGKKKRVIEVTTMLYETSHLEVKKNKVTIRKIGIDPLDTAVPKITGNITTEGLLGWSNEIEIAVGQTLPLPMTLLGLAYKIKV